MRLPLLTIHLTLLVVGLAVAPAYADVGVPPVLGVSWAPSHTTPGATVQLRFDIGNPGTSAPLTGVAFNLSLPAGVSVGTIGATVIGCGTVSASAPSTIHFTGGTIPANAPSSSSPCNFQITISTSTAGVFTATSTAITSNEGGAGSTASADLVVGSAPTISKSFGAATIGLNQSTTLTFGLVNPNESVSATGVGFSDALPAGLVVATPNGLSSTCGGTATAVAGSGTVELSGVTMAGAGTCTLTVNVTGTTAGVKNNSVQITSANLGTGNTSNTSIRVLAPPTLTKAFGVAQMELSASTSLTFTVSNSNGSNALTGIAFSDTLPAGLVVATPNGATGTCLTTAGLVTTGGTLTAVTGSGSISISGLGLAASGSCTFAVNVTATSAGVKSNTTGSISSTNGGTGGTATASVTVIGPPTVASAFGAATVDVEGSTSLTFTITNPNSSTTLTGIALSDTLPAGLVVATPSGATGTCLTTAGVVTAGGTLTAAAGSGSIGITGLGVAASGSCTFAVNVTAKTPGIKSNTTGSISSVNGGTGNTTTASLTVAAPVPALSDWGLAILAMALIVVAWRSRSRWSQAV